MRLMTFRSDAGKESVGALLGDDRVLDLTAAGGGAPMFSSMVSLIEAGEAGLAAARKLMANPPATAVKPLSEVRLLAPIPRPPRMRACSLDALHLQQANQGMTRIMTRNAPDPDAAFEAAIKARGAMPAQAWYDTPVYWFMDNYCVSGPDDKVTWPAYSDWIDYELEIGAVIGKAGRDIAKKDAEDYIFGYTIVNDLSARDAQWKASATGLSITAKGKDFEGSYPMGPCIVTRDEIRHRDMQAKLTVNGEVLGRGSPRNAHWGFDDAIVYMSQGAPLVPGEVITSATVANCCAGEMARKGSRGDVVELDVEGIGTLRTYIV